MKLISLTCDQHSFKPLFFRKKGLSLVVGDKSKEGASSNGVGKTLALKLVHHCLGASKDSFLETNLPNWVFTLTFELNERTHTISRRGDGKQIKLDGQVVPYKKLTAWLDRNGPFETNVEDSGLSFRSLYRRFARVDRADRTDPVKLTNERDHQALVITLYLLGIDIALVLKKIALRTEQQKLDNLQKFLNTHSLELQNVTSTNVKPAPYLKRLQSEIKALQENINTMEIADDYQKIKSEADTLTLELREKENEIAILEYQLRGIDASLENRPDIAREALLSFYEGLGDIFKPNALKDFEDVESFHTSLTAQRHERLNRERQKLTVHKEDIESQRSSIASRRDSALKYLSGKSALDDYMAIIRTLASKEESARIIAERIEEQNKTDQDLHTIKEEMVKQDGHTNDYLKTEPASYADRKFRDLFAQIYPQEIVEITLKNNTRDNKIRYDLSVYAPSQGSDGINAMRIICFDWIFFMYGAHHNMKHLWHDNGLFDHVDPQQRAKWLNLVIEDIKNTDKQYIVSLNTENYETLLTELNEHNKNLVEDSVIIKLSGNAPEHKLLGTQIGTPEA